MKGVSAVIATILMLMITIALAGTAYLYITGVFTARTGIVLSVDQASICNSTTITVYTRNDGTGVASNVLVDLTSPNGAITTNGCAALASINAGTTGTTTCAKPDGAGSYGVRVYTGAISANGNVYCAS